MNKKIAQNIVVLIGVSIFLTAEVILYALFLAEDFGEANLGVNVALKYSTVALAFLFSFALLIFAQKGDKQGFGDDILLSAALSLTLVSDLFLLVLGKFFEVGLVTFIGAQLCHFARIKRTKAWTIVSILLRALLPSIAIIVLATTSMVNALYVLVSIYFVQLVMNFAESFASVVVTKTKVERVRMAVLALGFLLFIGCDICVGLLNLYGTAGELIWLFYTPSQVLIVLSSRRLYENSPD